LLIAKKEILCWPPTFSGPRQEFRVTGVATAQLTMLYHCGYFLMWFKKIFKYIKKAQFFGVLAKPRFPKKAVNYVFYAKAPTCHRILGRLVDGGLKDFFVLVDDQVGFSSDCSSYPRYVRVKERFSLRGLLESISSNEFIVLDRTIRSNLAILEKACFVNMWDRSPEVSYIFANYGDLFPLTVTIQHGSLGSPDLYFPFPSKVFLARSVADAEVALRYKYSEPKKIIVAGNLAISKYVTRGALEKRIMQQISRPHKNLLFATRYGIWQNIRFLVLVARIGDSDSRCFFKPHPSDKLIPVYRLIIFLMRSAGIPVFFVKDLENHSFSYLITESSSLINEMLYKGTLPIIFNPHGDTLPEYVESWFFRVGPKDYSVNKADAHYRGKVGDLLRYYLRYNHQTTRFSSVGEACVEALNRCSNEHAKVLASISVEEI